mmetsp:Transcript_141602/g.244891  ORF Transcript_141602/g.244891 Transcript_141602/m.244891 type:complete len:545 (+) Transcript_141602:88-1722(+)
MLAITVLLCVSIAQRIDSVRMTVGPAAHAIGDLEEPFLRASGFAKAPLDNTLEERSRAMFLNEAAASGLEGFVPSECALKARASESDMSSDFTVAAEVRSYAIQEAQDTDFNLILEAMETMDEPLASAPGVQRRNALASQVLDHEEEVQDSSKEGLCLEEDSESAQAVYDRVTCYASQGHFGMAEEILRKLFKHQENELGQDHNDTLETALALSDLLVRKQHELDEARELARRVLEGREQALGKNDKTMLKTASFLAGLVQGRGDMDEVATLLRRVYKGTKESHGDKHPKTVLANFKLAEALRMLEPAGDVVKEVVKILEEVIDDLSQDRNTEALLTPLLPKSEVQVLLAHVYQERDEPGDSSECERLLRQVIEESEEEDERTLKTKYLLAKHLSSRTSERPRQDLKDAYDLLLPTLEVMELPDKQGKSHVDTLEAAACLAHILKRSNQLASAEVCYKYALEGLKFVLGADDRQTMRVTEELESLRSLGSGNVAKVSLRLQNARERGIAGVTELLVICNGRLKERAAKKFSRAAEKFAAVWGRK